MAVVTNCECTKGICTVKADKTQKCTVLEGSTTFIMVILAINSCACQASARRLPCICSKAVIASYGVVILHIKMPV